jgi:hypothetical protein
VLVNWTGLPLLWGRCRTPAPVSAPTRTSSGHSAAMTAAAKSELFEGLQVVAGQGQDTGAAGAVFGARAGLSRQGGQLMRSASMRSVTAWNARRPAALLFSLPDEPGWDPCVSVRGTAAAAWRRIADDADNAAAGGGVGLRDGEAHRRTFGLSLPATVGGQEEL